MKISCRSVVEICLNFYLAFVLCSPFKECMKEEYWSHSHGYNISPKILQRWLDHNFWELLKRNVADYTRKMKHVFEIQAKYLKQDFSLGHNRLNWVPSFRKRSFFTKKLSCVRNFERGFLEYVISRWRHRIYMGKQWKEYYKGNIRP